MKLETIKKRVISKLTKNNQMSNAEAERLFEENYKYFSVYTPANIAMAILSVR